MPTLHITLRQSTISASFLAQAIRKITGDEYTGSDAIAIARSMIEGKVWEPPASMFYLIRYRADQLHDLPFSLTITPDPNPWAEEEAKLKMTRQLLEAGAGGNAEAAIEYCKQMMLAPQNGSY